jgi:hypothetical protein
MRLIWTFVAGAALAAARDGTMRSAGVMTASAAVPAGQASRDGGVPVAEGATPDAGRPAAAAKSGAAEAQAEVDQLKDELQRMREAEALRAELQKSRAVEVEQAEQLGEVNQQLEQLRGELSSAVADQREAERQREAPAAAQRQVSANLLALDPVLATGDTNVLTTLEAAERVVGAGGRRNLALAREALENEDLATAREYVYRAALDAAMAR